MKSFLGVTAIAFLVYLVIHKGIIDGSPKIAHLININPAAVSFPITILLLLGLFTGLFFLFSSLLKAYPLALKWSRMVCIGLIFITIGYSSYEMIFIRSLKDPRIDENDPETVAAAVSYLQREQYGTHSWNREDAMRQNKSNVRYRGPFDFFWRYQFKQMYVRYFNWQYMGRAEGGGVGWNGAGVDLRQLWGLPFLIGILGAFYHFNRDWKRAFPVLVLFLMTGLAIVLYVNNPDPQPRERDYSYVGSFYAFAIWIGLGAAAIMDFVNRWIKKKKLRRSVLALTSVVLLLALPVNMLHANYRSHDRWGNYVASDYAYNLLNSCEEGAILFTNGDNDTFPLWYKQEVEEFRRDVKVVNLSLLNTPWYIKQLKNIEPELPLRWSEEQIEMIRPVPWEEQEITIAGLTTTVKPTYGGRYLRVQDLMVLELIKIADWEISSDFAATVSSSSRLGLEDYLSMEGQVLRLYPEKVDKVDEEKIYENFTSNYQFRNLNNERVYFNPNTQRLMQNYRTAALQGAMKFIDNGKPEKAESLLNALDKAIPEDIIPQYHPELSLQTGRLYHQLGDTAEYVDRISAVMERGQLDERTMMIIAQELIYTLEAYDKAEEILLPMYQENPNNNWVAGSLVRVYREREEYSKALNILDRWLRVAPNDQQAQSLKTQIERLANE
ncbi:MAG: tetratricopeptide repeat protein [Candidatus Marinimicrobia bacterium]|nr:tetratricopeptide repeat protein [Candidatus Neomarinimicrobiota bacterium]